MAMDDFLNPAGVIILPDARLVTFPAFPVPSIGGECSTMLFCAVDAGADCRRRITCGASVGG